jgi:hypothetical protein
VIVPSVTVIRVLAVCYSYLYTFFIPPCTTGMTLFVCVPVCIACSVYSIALCAVSVVYGRLMTAVDVLCYVYLVLPIPSS